MIHPDDIRKAINITRELVDRQMAEHLAKPGWSMLDDNDPVWAGFSEMYKFRPSTLAENWPGIAEPIPSRTYGIQHFYGPDFNQLTKELSEYYLACFKTVIPKGQSLFVLDWHHTCFVFDPHAGFEFESMEEWPISPLPNGDYYIFLTEDLKGGFFGHPWEQTICVMGEAFVDYLETAPSSVFFDLLRIDGVKV